MLRTTWILVLKGALNLGCKTSRILVLGTLKIRLQNDGSVNVFKSSYPSWRTVLKTGLQDVFKVHLCPLGCIVTPSCAFLSCLNISLLETNYHLANVWRHSWSFWSFIHGNRLNFPYRPVFTCHLFAILQDGVKRFYPHQVPYRDTGSVGIVLWGDLKGLENVKWPTDSFAAFDWTIYGR